MKHELDFLGVTPCGCAVAWISAEHSTRSQVAKEIAQWILDGYRVERVTTDESRRRLMGCKHKSRPAKQEELALGVGPSETPHP